MKPRIRETIVVEGRYDKNTVSQAVCAHILETRGFGVFSDDDLIALIRKIAEARGVIILSDSDGAGFLIRGKLKSVLGESGVKHAYIPDIEGKERRKRGASRTGLLGVEGMSREIIIQSLRQAGATFEDSVLPSLCGGAPITKSDMCELGLSGTKGAAARRNALKAALGLPRLLSANSLLEVLNCLCERSEFFELAKSLGSS